MGQSWSGTSSSTTSTAFTSGLKENINCKFMGVGVTSELSVSWSNTVSSTISSTQGGSVSVSCQSTDCSDGNLWQWTIDAVAKPGYSNQSSVQCSFACVPNS